MRIGLKQCTSGAEVERLHRVLHAAGLKIELAERRKKTLAFHPCRAEEIPDAKVTRARTAGNVLAPMVVDRAVQQGGEAWMGTKCRGDGFVDEVGRCAQQGEWCHSTGLHVHGVHAGAGWSGAAR